MAVTFADTQRRDYANSWWWTRAEVDMDRLPVTVGLSVPAVLKATVTSRMFVIACYVGLLPVLGGWTIDLLEARTPDTSIALHLLFVFPYIAVFFAVNLLSALWNRRWITFDASGVTVVQRAGLFGWQTWSLPYADYQGVLQRAAEARGVFVGARMQVIELQHRDPEKTVPLYVQARDDPPRAQWKAYAARLGVPALSMAGDDEELTDLADIGAEVVAAARGLPAASSVFDPGAPPAGIEVDTAPGGGRPMRRVSVTRGATSPFFVGFLFILGIAFAIGGNAIMGISLGFQPWRVSFPDGSFFLAGIWFLAILTMALLDRSKRRAVRFSGPDLFVADETQRRAKRLRTFRLAEIEDIRVKRPDLGFSNVLLIADGSQQIEFGQGLSRRALEWLRDDILAAVARA